MADFYRATEAFAFVDDNGVPWPITPGTLVTASDPAYKGRESLFEPVEASVHRSSRTSHATETATAEPGQRRHRGRMTKAEREAEEKAHREAENTPPQGKKNFDPPPQAIDGPEPEPPGPPTTGAVNFDEKPQQVDGGELTEPEPTGEKNDDPKPQQVDGGESKAKGK
jgi:hypothetical protein